MTLEAVAAFGAGVGFGALSALISMRWLFRDAIAVAYADGRKAERLELEGVEEAGDA